MTAFLVTGAAYAQQAQQTGAPPPGVTGTASSGLEEIVITAEKRVEKTQDVPVSVNTVSQRDIENSGVSDINELGPYVAGLDIPANGSVLLPFVRGVGNVVATAANDPSVAIYVDGQYIPRLFPGFFELQDIQQVDVLKGPQGTLFGRNASGGLINVVTRDPSFTDYEVEASAGYDNYDTNTEKLYVSVPLSDSIAFNISGYHADQGRGWGTNYATHQPYGWDDPTTLHSKWIFKVADDLKVTLTANYSHDRTDEGQEGPIVPGQINGVPLYLTGAPFNIPEQKFRNVGFYNALNATDNETLDSQFGGSLRIDYNLGFATFSSITASQNDRDQYRNDGLYNPIYFVTSGQTSPTRTQTQEFQLTSAPDSPFDWVAGLYYLNEYAGTGPLPVYGPGFAYDIFGGAFGPTLPAASRLTLFGFQLDQSYSAYSQATFHVLPDTNLTLGARYTFDRVQAHGHTDIDVPGTYFSSTSTSASSNFEKPTFKVALDHHFTPDLMSYVSISRGFKAGLYNITPVSAPPIKPEVNTAYELGVKSTWFDNTLRLNGSLFDNQITDPQLYRYNPLAHSIINFNADQAETKGVDLDGQYAILKDLVATFSAEYLDAHYTSFTGAPIYYPVLTPPYGAGVGEGNGSGLDMVYAPRWTFNVGLNYSLETTLGAFDLNANESFNSGYAENADNLIRQRAFNMVNAALTYIPTDYENFEVQVWGKNLLQQRIYLNIGEAASSEGFVYAPGAPTTYGVSVTYRFSMPRNAAEPMAPIAAAEPAPAPAAPPPAAPVEAKRSFQVFFDFDKSDITQAAAQVIQAAADAVKAGNVVQITVTGHTDTVGTAAYNQGLSERRAAAVKGSLVADGVAGGEITTIGVGKTGLLVPTADGVREPQNRRAEIVLQ